jgi:dihydrofolate reductase
MTVTTVRKDPQRLTMTIEAEFDAAPERVWQLWADPRQLERWWGGGCDHVRQPTRDELCDKETAPMKLTTTAQISVDGVMQAPGGPEEDERGRFERGGWAHFDDVASTVMDQIYQRAEEFLFGRRTYEIFASSWGTWGDPGDSPIWTALNTKLKYVASTTLTSTRWENTTVLSCELTAAVRELKARPGGELQVHGSGALFRYLLENDLVDEITLFTFPVVVGQGRRLFPETGFGRALELVGSQASPSGVTIQAYRPAGRPQYAE